MMDYNRVEVRIYGKRYVLQTEDSPEYIKELARQMDRRFQDLYSLDENISYSDAAVLVGLEILDESVKANSNIDHIRMQVKAYVEEAADSRLKMEKYKKELEEAKQTIEKLQTELDMYSLRDQIEKTK